MYNSQFNFKLCLCCLLLGATALGQTPAREAELRNCSLSGRVTIEGKPAANATITVMPAGAENPRAVISGQVENFYAKAVTDGEGRYQFFNLPPGHLLVRAFSQAYVSKGQSQAAADIEEQRQGGEVITLAVGEQRTDCDFEVVRGGVITGRVTEESGKPVANEHIRLLVLDKENRLNFAFLSSSAARMGTDDRGIYRLFGLPAGRYVVCVGAGQFKQGDAYQSFSDSRYRLTFYPDSETPDKAKIIEVKEGSEATEIDLKVVRLKEGPTYAISGRALDADTGDPVPFAGLRLARRSEGAGRNFWHAPADAHGNFRFEGLKRGQYILQYDPFFGREREEHPNHYADQIKFEVSEEAVNGLELHLQRGAIISGVVVIEGEGTPAGLPLSIRKSPVWEELIEQQQTGQIEDLQQEQVSAKVGAGGQFSMMGARPGHFTLVLTEDGVVGKPLKLLRVERNGVNLGTRLTLNPREQLTDLRVVAQRATGSLRGQVKFSGGSFPAGFRLSVGVMSEELLRRQEGGERVVYSSFASDIGNGAVDEAGNFLIERLIPGSYRLQLQAYPIKAGGSEPPFEQITQRVFVNAQGETAVTINVELGKKH